VRNVSDVRQTEIHTDEPLVPGPSRLEVKIAIAKLKKYKSSGSDQIPAELIQAGGEILLSQIHKLINSVWNKEELPDQWKEPIIVPIRKKDDKTDCNNYRGPPLWSSGQSSWLQIWRPRFDSRHYQKKNKVVGLEQGPLSLVSTAEELLSRKSRIRP
jgi:hypothetical protein